MSEHLTQKLRRILDVRFLKKGVLFWCLSPLLFCISFVFAFVAYLRRCIGYADFKSLQVPIPPSLHVICVGNILVGGTGKSPLVRLFAELALVKDEIVAIAARGISSKPAWLDSQNFKNEDIEKLSDENREHFEILRYKFPTKQFFIFQNKNRRQSLIKYISLLTSRGLTTGSNKKCVFILDDGLQHFSCPRHINMCVSDVQLNKNAPPYAIPIGPYREGFGRKSIQKLLASFDARIWTNLDPPRGRRLKRQSICPRGDIVKHGDAVIPRLDCGIHEFYATYKIQFVQFHIHDNGEFNFQPIMHNEISFQKSNNPLIIAGIAHPKRFVNDLQHISIQFELCDTIFLSDHGSLNQLCLNKLEQSSVVILTLKDFFRFCTNPSFLKLCQTRSVYGCYPEYSL